MSAHTSFKIAFFRPKLPPFYCQSTSHKANQLTSTFAKFPVFQNIWLPREQGVTPKPRTALPRAALIS